MGNTNTKELTGVTTHITSLYDDMLADPDGVIQVLTEHMSLDNKIHVRECCSYMPTIEKQLLLQNLKDLSPITVMSSDTDIQSVLNIWATLFKPFQLTLCEKHFNCIV